MHHSRRITRSRVALAFLGMFLFASVAFAGDPIPGVDVGRGRNPPCTKCDAAITDAHGDFTLSNNPAGTFTLTFTAQDAKNMMAVASRTNRKTYGPAICPVLTFAPSGTVTINGKAQYGPISLSLTKSTTITVVLSKPGTVSGTLTTSDTTPAQR
jgi:hypothetical protein